MIPKETEATIVRLFHVEQWKIGTIARQLKIHHETIRRVLRQNGIVPPERQQKPSQLDPYMPFVMETLNKYPSLTASRLHTMVRERGYKGGYDHFRALVRRVRPRPVPEAYLRVRTLPGEQAQVDWAHCGKLKIGNAERRLLAFVMVLSYSRRMFVRFYLGDATDNFLRGHVAAFECFGGVPRECLYDNLKSAVLERRGEAIHFNPTLLALANHYRFAPKPVAVARDNEKGRVERAIQYLRSAFLAGRDLPDLDTLNAQVLAWCEGEASARPCPGANEMSVAQAFAQEVPMLLPLPADHFATDERVAVKVGKTPYVRFDLNDYSVPFIHVRKTLQVVASLTTVRILDGATVVATHARSFDKGWQVENPDHVAGLVAWKQQARQGRGMDRLHHAVPASQALFLALAERRGNLGALTSSLLNLLDTYGAVALNRAVAEALEAGVLHKAGIRQVLDRHAHERQVPPPVAVRLPDEPRVRELLVRPHSLELYDAVGRGVEEVTL
jgi:transposase